MALPEAEWLTLQEALERTMKAAEVSAVEAMEALSKAIRNDVVKSRGRCRSYFRHDTQSRLRGIEWDQAKISWDESQFAVPDPEERHQASWRRRPRVFTDVEVERLSLDGWLGKVRKSNAQSSYAPPSTDGLSKGKPGAKPRFDRDAAIRYMMQVANSPDGLPETQADRIKMVADFYSDRFDQHPSATWLKQFVKHVCPVEAT